MMVDSRCCESPEDGSLPSTCWHCRNTADTFLKRRRTKMLTEHREGRGFFGLEKSAESFTERRFELSLGLLWCMWGWEWERVRASFIQLPSQASPDMPLWAHQSPPLAGKFITRNAGNNGTAEPKNVDSTARESLRWPDLGRLFPGLQSCSL